MAKRPTLHIYKRTLWAIRQANGRLMSTTMLSSIPRLFETRAEAEWCAGDGETPVKVRERIEVIG